MRAIISALKGQNHRHPSSDEGHRPIHNLVCATRPFVPQLVLR
jgi:hypothetical protein